MHERAGVTPYGATPSARQQAWHAREFYGFLHFTVNTFTDREWGYGDETPDMFAPTEFDAAQIVADAQRGGMHGLILTAKHHDGFCLWPSRYTQHSVASSAWRNGQGDVVGEIAAACAAAGLRFGVYLSPWDRNHAEYGRPAYLTYYRNQLRELLTQYGPIFEVWFDGANGGDGFYGGAREHRTIDAQTYYGWDETIALVRELQPEACIFSDAGPDVRWVGNEQGIAGEPCWATIDAAGLYPGYAEPARLNSGQRGGAEWLPAECDVSIRPGWFYHAHEDDKVRSPENLLDVYLKSVGRGANLLVNLPLDRRGLVHPIDAAALAGFAALRARLTAVPLTGHIEPAPAQRLPAAVVWMPAAAELTPTVTLRLAAAAKVGVVDIGEAIAYGQRIWGWELAVDRAGVWETVAAGESIGYRRLVVVGGAPVTAVRLRITAAGAPAVLRLFTAYEQ
jgi:alpha-L-fucosidase